jgi:hypothetical protein
MKQILLAGVFALGLSAPAHAWPYKCATKELTDEQCEPYADVPYSGIDFSTRFERGSDAFHNCVRENMSGLDPDISDAERKHLHAKTGRYCIINSRDYKQSRLCEADPDWCNQ